MGVPADDKFHLWEVGIGVRSWNCCNRTAAAEPPEVSRRRRVGVIKSPPDEPVIAQEIDSEIEKVCGH